MELNVRHSIITGYQRSTCYFMHRSICHLGRKCLYSLQKSFETIIFSHAYLNLQIPLRGLQMPIKCFHNMPRSWSKMGQIHDLSTPPDLPFYLSSSKTDGQSL